MSNNDSEFISLPRNHTVNLEFRGKLVTSVSSNVGGTRKRWTELNLYLTQGNTFVAQVVGQTAVEQEIPFSKVTTFDNLHQATDAFKDRGNVTWLTLQMYDAIAEVYPSFNPSEAVA